MSIVNSTLAVSLTFVSWFMSAAPLPAPVSAAQLLVLDDDGTPLTRLTDGDMVRLQLTLQNRQANFSRLS
jgi:hypothetical protein